MVWLVNSVGSDNKPTKYSRKGKVLEFFTKPDVSYYGGTPESYIKVCEPLGEAFVSHLICCPVDFKKIILSY